MFRLVIVALATVSLASCSTPKVGPFGSDNTRTCNGKNKRQVNVNGSVLPGGPPATAAAAKGKRSGRPAKGASAAPAKVSAATPPVFYASC